MKLHLLVKLQCKSANKKVRNKNDLDSQIWNECLILSTESIYGAVFPPILACASNAQLELEVAQTACEMLSFLQEWKGGQKYQHFCISAKFPVHLSSQP